MARDQANRDEAQEVTAPNPASRFCTGGVCFLCFAFSLLAVILFLSIMFVALDVPLGDQAISLRGLIRHVFSVAIIPVIIFLSEIIKSLFPWAIVALVALFLLAWGPDRVERIFRSMKLELPGLIKLDGSAVSDTFKKEMGDAQKTAGKTNKEIEEAYGAAKAYLAQLRGRYGIDQLVGRLSSDIARVLGESCPDDFRLTVYIRDLVFDNQLYQLVEYFNQDGQQTTEGKSGRAYSIRYGIIGRVWRSGVAEVEGELISQEDRELLGENPDVREVEKFIARRWGLTLDEAVRVRPYQSYGAIRIERGERPPGLIFFDSQKKNAFGDRVTQRKIEATVQNSDLAVRLLEISRETDQFARIQIFRSR